MADPAAADCRLGPVNNAEAYEKFRQAAARPTATARVVAGAEVLTDGAFANGYFVAPTIVADLPAGHRLTRDELFVPFVMVERVADLDAGDRSSPTTSRSASPPACSARTRPRQERFLDASRPASSTSTARPGATTGAWPGYQTFGGWKGSGSTGKSAFGPHYVQLFMREQSRTILP